MRTVDLGGFLGANLIGGMWWKLGKLVRTTKAKPGIEGERPESKGPNEKRSHQPFSRLTWVQAIIQGITSDELEYEIPGWKNPEPHQVAHRGRKEKYFQVMWEGGPVGMPIKSECTNHCESICISGLK